MSETNYAQDILTEGESVAMVDELFGVTVESIEKKDDKYLFHGENGEVVELKKEDLERSGIEASF